MMIARAALLLFSVLTLLVFPASSERVTVAVAANAYEPVRVISIAFEKETGHDVRLVSGSTGKLFNQIMLGAPYDVFLSADGERPERLVEDERAIPESRITYVVGELVLWAPEENAFPNGGEAALEAGGFRRLAVANPDLAPYGRAAQQTLAALGLSETVSEKLAFGESVGQAFSFIATGNAELGFVAHAQVQGWGGSAWVVPEALYDPIRQDGVLLTRSADNVAARAFMTYLTSDAARNVFRSSGYRVEP